MVKAHIWYAIAADRQIDGAAENRDRVAKLLTPEQLKKAKEEALDWINWRKPEQ